MKPRALSFVTPSGKEANRRAAHDEFCVDAKKALQNAHSKSKRKATEIQEDVAIHKERTRRITNEHARAEGHVNDGIGSLGKACKQRPGLHTSLTCGVPDRESNEVKYLREAPNSDSIDSKVGNE